MPMSSLFHEFFTDTIFTTDERNPFHGPDQWVSIYPRPNFYLQSSRIRVDLLSYESKTTDKRQQNDCRAKKNLDGSIHLSIYLAYKSLCLSFSIFFLFEKICSLTFSSALSFPCLVFLRLSTRQKYIFNDQNKI